MHLGSRKISQSVRSSRGSQKPGGKYFHRAASYSRSLLRRSSLPASESVRLGCEQRAEEVSDIGPRRVSMLLCRKCHNCRPRAIVLQPHTFGLNFELQSMLLGTDNRFPKPERACPPPIPRALQSSKPTEYFVSFCSSPRVFLIWDNDKLLGFCAQTTMS